MKIRIENALAQARAAENGRHAELVVSDGPLRQTIIALMEGVSLQEHNSPPAASIHVLQGALTVTAGGASGEFVADDIAALTHERHAVTAEEDSVFVLTTVTSQPDRGSHGA